MLAVKADEGFTLVDMTSGSLKDSASIPWEQGSAEPEATVPATPWVVEHEGLGASVAFDGAVTLWDTERGQSIGILEVPGAFDSSALVFDPQGRSLAVASTGGEMSLIDTDIESWHRRGVPTRRPLAHRRGVEHVHRIRRKPAAKLWRIAAASSGPRNMVLRTLCGLQGLGAKSPSPNPPPSPGRGSRSRAEREGVTRERAAPITRLQNPSITGRGSQSGRRAVRPSFGSGRMGSAGRGGTLRFPSRSGTGPIQPRTSRHRWVGGRC